jgi:hypothetical protein
MNVYVIVRRNNRGVTQEDELVLDDNQQHAFGVSRANNNNPFWPVVGIRAATLKDFWGACNRHDWYHMMSDDHRVHMRGARAGEDLKAMAKALGPGAEQLLASWKPDAPPGRPS